MISTKLRRKIIIAGPCGAETKEQIEDSVREAKNLQVDFLRVNLWKPRTKPGFEGLQKEGLELMIAAAKAGITPGTEVIMPQHAKLVIKHVLAATKNGKVLIWIGARNQNHFIQREISKIASKNNRVILMVKNQIWHNEKHWEGIVEHIMSGGIKKENLLLCHRGFAPIGENPNGYRNVPDFDMAMRIKEKTGIPMIFDPSHTGGSIEKVFKISQEADNFDFDGYMVEVHPNPKQALSDADQQLTWTQFKLLLKDLYNRRVEKTKSPDKFLSKIIYEKIVN